MSNYIIVKNNDINKSYKMKTTHTSSPYIEVNAVFYLDIDTQTTRTNRADIIYNNSRFRIREFISTSTTTIQKNTITTAYSGQMSRESSYTVTTAITGKTSYTYQSTTNTYYSYRSSSNREWYSGYSISYDATTIYEARLSISTQSYTSTSGKGLYNTGRVATKQSETTNSGKGSGTMAADGSVWYVNDTLRRSTTRKVTNKGTKSYTRNNTTKETSYSISSSYTTSSTGGYDYGRDIFYFSDTNYDNVTLSVYYTYDRYQRYHGGYASSVTYYNSINKKIHKYTDITAEDYQPFNATFTQNYSTAFYSYQTVYGYGTSSAYNADYTNTYMEETIETSNTQYTSSETTNAGISSTTGLTEQSTSQSNYYTSYTSLDPSMSNVTNITDEISEQTTIDIEIDD